MVLLFPELRFSQVKTLKILWSWSFLTHFISILGPSTSDLPLLIAPTAAPTYMMSSNPVSQLQQLLVWDQHIASNSHVRDAKSESVFWFFYKPQNFCCNHYDDEITSTATLCHSMLVKKRDQSDLTCQINMKTCGPSFTENSDLVGSLTWQRSWFKGTFPIKDTAVSS